MIGSKLMILWKNNKHNTTLRFLGDDYYEFCLLLKKSFYIEGLNPFKTIVLIEYPVLEVHHCFSSFMKLINETIPYELKKKNHHLPIVFVINSDHP